MIIGVPTEILNKEYRAGLTPSAASDYINAGHKVIIQKGAGEGSSFSDDLYESVGCTVVDTAEEVWKQAEMIIKVKEPVGEELDLIQEGQIIYTYLHLAANREVTEALVKSGAVCVGYETVELDDGSLPLLAPMSEIAGHMAAQVGGFFLQKTAGGSGVLMGGVSGVKPAKVMVLGAGMVGSNAAQVAIGMGADVTVVDINLSRLKQLSEMWGSSVKTLYSSRGNILEVIPEFDIVIGAVLVPGAKAPWLVTSDMIKLMKEGSVVVDVAIDQGGCIETSRVTTHDNPTFYVDGVLHYGVANMPGAVPATSTRALNNATLHYGLALANKGWRKAFEDDRALARGANIIMGDVVHKGVAEAHDMAYLPIKEAIAKH